VVLLVTALEHESRCVEDAKLFGEVIFGVGILVVPQTNVRESRKIFGFWRTKTYWARTF
jgi:hypothetical protein